MHKNGPNILIIDDDEINNFIAKKLIDKTEFKANINTFLNGETSLSFLKTGINNETELPDIIFLDLNMPIMNGWEFLDLYQTEVLPFINKKPIINIISSSVYNNDMLKAETYSFINKFVSKPLTVDKIKEMLHQAEQH